MDEERRFFPVPGPDEWCDKCGKWVPQDMLFCAACGTKNPRFDDTEFLMQFDETVEEYLARECQRGHPDVMRDLKNDVTLSFANSPFCTVCGERIFHEQN